MIMKLLITMGLSDRLLEHYIHTITLLEKVSKIIIVRDEKGPKLNKVIYHTPPEWSLKFPILKTFWKFFMLIFLSVKEKPFFINSYLLNPHGLIVFIAGKLTNTKIGVTLNAGPVDFYTLEGSPIGKYAYSKSMPKISGIGRILLAILKKFDFITVTGTFTKRILIENGVPKNRIFIMPRAAPNAFDERFRPRDISQNFDIVYIGRLARVKHVETLIEAISMVKKDYPNIKVAIIGDGPEKNNLQELSKKMNVGENIIFTGYQTDIWDWYNKAKISVITSEREGFPYSVVESLSCGVPVIASNCGDICDVIKDCYNGVIIGDYHDYQSFAEAIINVLQNPQIITEYSNNALRTAENLTIEKAVLVWKEILRYLYGDDQV